MTRVLYSEPGPRAALATSPRQPRELHARLPGYAPTPLIELPALADALGVGRLLIKLESDRLGLPSFKVLGASWATMQALAPYLPVDWRPADGIGPLAGRLPDLTLVAATDGNHGRALAVMASLLGLRARVYVPAELSEERQEAIAAEGARVIVVDGSYDEAVACSAAELGPADVLVSDTSWPGYETVPAAVIDGYSTIMWELDEQLAEASLPTPDLVFVQLGVGAFGAAVIRHFRSAGSSAPRLVGVEPERAACVMASVAADRIVTEPGPHDSIMAGLNCGTPSLVAWPLLRAGLECLIAIEDEPVLDAVGVLAEHGVRVGECSAGALAAATELMRGPFAREHRGRLGIAEDAVVLLFATEGVTDEATFRRAIAAHREVGKAAA